MKYLGIYLILCFLLLHYGAAMDKKKDDNSERNKKEERCHTNMNLDEPCSMSISVDTYSIQISDIGRGTMFMVTPTVGVTAAHMFDHLPDSQEITPKRLTVHNVPDKSIVIYARGKLEAVGYIKKIYIPNMYTMWKSYIEKEFEKPLTQIRRDKQLKEQQGYLPFLDYYDTAFFQLHEPIPDPKCVHIPKERVDLTKVDLKKGMRSFGTKPLTEEYPDCCITELSYNKFGNLGHNLFYAIPRGSLDMSSECPLQKMCGFSGGPVIMNMSGTPTYLGHVIAHTDNSEKRLNIKDRNNVKICSMSDIHSLLEEVVNSAEEPTPPPNASKTELDQINRTKPW